MSKTGPTRTRISTMWSRLEVAGRQNPLLPSLGIGVVRGVINVMLAISLSALLFADSLSSFAAPGIGLVLLSGSVAMIVTGWLSSASGTIIVTQDAPAAILAVSAAAIAHSLPASTPPDETFITVVAAIAMTSLATGLTFILFGHFKLGGLVRFLPYPVVGGFLAGSGWLLVTGGIGMMMGSSVDLARLPLLFHSSVWMRWVPGVLLAIMMLAVLNRYRHVFLLPGMLTGFLLLFYTVAWLNGTTLEQLSADRWLLGPFPSEGLWRPLAFTDLAHVHWFAIAQHATGLTPVILVSVVSLLLNASGIELVIRRDLDLNHELQAAGVGSVLSGLLGGLVTFHSLSGTALNYRTANGSRLSGWITALFCMLPLFFGAELLAYVPKVVLGCLLILLGLDFLWEWVYLAWFKFPRVEYLIILLIVGISATAGYLPAVEVGMMAAVVLFVVNYSRVNIVKHALNGTEFQSRVTRKSKDWHVLGERGAELYILQLQGFLFFGTAHNLLERVRQRINQPALRPVRFVVLDFDQITGLDSTAVLSFLKMYQLAHEHRITLLIAGANAEIQRQLEQGGFVGHNSEDVLLCPDIDHALEWCENRILVDAGIPSDETRASWQDQFGDLVGIPDTQIALLNYLKRHDLAAGEYLMHEGDLPDHVYFLTAGQVTARLEQAGRVPVRLETMRAGRVVGELGFYLGTKRTAAVVADEPSTVYQLSARSLAQMEREAPHVAAAVHQLIAQLLAERARHLIVAVRSLQRKP